MGINSFVKKGKDLTVSKTLKFFVNSKIENYGKVESLKLNSDKKKIDMIIFLKGEDKAIDISINEYTVKREKDGIFITLSDVATSRTWLTNLINDQITDSKILIPEKFGNIAENLI